MDNIYIPATEPEFLTMKEVGRRIKVSDEVVRLWVVEGLPCLPLGKRMTRFVWSEVWAWVVARGKTRKVQIEMGAGLHGDHWE